MVGVLRNKYYSPTFKFKNIGKILLGVDFKVNFLDYGEGKESNLLLS